MNTDLLSLKWETMDQMQTLQYSSFLPLGQAFMEHRLGIPPPKALPNWNPDQLMPHCIVGDEAFPLQLDLMRPYPRGTGGTRMPRDQRIFNYRLSRARRIVENAFGILAQRFRFLNRRIALSPQNCGQSGKSCLCTTQLAV